MKKPVKIGFAIITMTLSLVINHTARADQTIVTKTTITYPHTPGKIGEQGHSDPPIFRTYYIKGDKIRIDTRLSYWGASSFITRTTKSLDGIIVDNVRHTFNRLSFRQPMHGTIKLSDVKLVDTGQTKTLLGQAVHLYTFSQLQKARNADDLETTTWGFWLTRDSHSASNWTSILIDFPGVSSWLRGLPLAWSYQTTLNGIGGTPTKTEVLSMSNAMVNDSLFEYPKDCTPAPY